MKQRLVVIVGPTAVGKSDIGVKIAKRVNGEVISGDSVQIYRRLDIGSAKVSPEEQQGVPHHMLDILDPDGDFSVAIFQKLVLDLIEDINSRDKIPIIVGGTGLYVRSVLDPYDFPDAEENKLIRSRLKDVAEEKGKEHLHELLAQVDPITAERLHPNDSTRVIRALEVFYLTGEKFSSFQKSIDLDYGESPFRLNYFGLKAPRELLYDRINKRVDLMLQAGLEGEVRGLLADGYPPNLPALKTIGYRHMVQYLRGLLNFQEAVRLLKRDTRRFAKRQLTWFRRDPRITWFDVVDTPIEEIVNLMVEMICSKGKDSVE